MSQQSDTRPEEAQSEDQADGQETVGDEYVRQTMYLRESRKKALSDWFKLLELNFIDDVDSSICESIEHRRVMHEALVEHAMKNPQEYVETLKEIR